MHTSMYFWIRFLKATMPGRRFGHRTAARGRGVGGEESQCNSRGKSPLRAHWSSSQVTEYYCSLCLCINEHDRGRKTLFNIQKNGTKINIKNKLWSSLWEAPSPPYTGLKNWAKIFKINKYSRCQQWFWNIYVFCYTNIVLIRTKLI